MLQPNFTTLRAELACLRTLAAALRLQLAFKANFNPAQPRVPAGELGAGQWTNGGGNADRARVAQNTPRGGRGTGRGGEATPAQAARLAVSEARVQAALRRVRELDPTWRPTANMWESVEGRIAVNEATALEAEPRLVEFARVGIGPGPFAGESIPARGPRRDFTPAERGDINRIGSETGCHTCGTFTPGTPSGNFVPDHQMPNALNFPDRPQRLYPHCLTCSLRQGGSIRHRASDR